MIVQRAEDPADGPHSKTNTPGGVGWVAGPWGAGLRVSGDPLVLPLSEKL